MGQLVNRRLSKGFTLSELVIVLALVSVLAVSVLTQWPGRALNLDGLAHQLAGDIRYVQSLSMTRGQRFRINFSVGPPASYSISDRTGATPVAHPVVGVASVPIETSVTMTTSNTLLVFDGKGTPYSDGALPGTPLGGDATVTLSHGTDSRMVTVSRETGRVLVQ